MKNVNDKVRDWLLEKTGVDANECVSGDKRIRKNTDGSWLVNLYWLESLQLATDYFDFLKSNKQ